jgi:imidazolonepropionase-like amidohydrolase
MKISVRRHVRVQVVIALCWLAGPTARPLGADPALAGARAALAQAAQQTPAPGSSGKFRLHKFEQPIGEESYVEGGATAGGVFVRTFSIDFEFTDRGTPVALHSMFSALQDLTPISFAIAGRNARTAAINEAVEAGNDTRKTTVRVREDKTWHDEPRPQQFFTIAGYAPATMQMLLVQYWKEHGSPATLKTFPTGEVKIEPRGSDEIKIGDRTEELQRFTIEGLIWGRETLWFDAKMQLIAEISTDAEFDHFEAIRDGYEAALGTFVGRAGVDEMAALAQIGKGIPGVRADAIEIQGGTLIDGKGGPPIENANVVIEDGKIIAVGPGVHRPYGRLPKKMSVISAKGMTILPGLWDMHAHFEQVEWGPIYLAAGATTVRDCGNELEFITAVRDAIANGRGLGPRILAAGIVDGDSLTALGVQRVNNPEQAKQWVDRYHELGFQQMKIYSSVKRDNVAAVAAEAHRLGMTVTGHIPEGMTAYDGVNAGMDQINHIQYVAAMMTKPLPPDATRAERREAEAHIDLNSPEAQRAIEFLKAHGTVIDPTLVVFETFTAGPDRPLVSMEPGVAKVAPELATQFAGAGAPAEFRDQMRRLFATEVAITGALHRAGIPMVAGTDQSVPGYSLYREMELYVQAGFTPMEAIQAATIVPARVMKMDAELGTVEVGKRADLILVDGNPLEDIHQIRNVKVVITGGVAYHCAQLWQSVGFRP